MRQYPQPSNIFGKIRSLFSRGAPARISVDWFILRREPYYHKVQYSKTPKADVAAAVFGVILSAFVGYLTLSSLASAGADLTDLCVLFWYCFVAYRCATIFIFLSKNSFFYFFNPLLCFIRLCFYIVFSTFKSFF